MQKLSDKQLKFSTTNADYISAIDIPLYTYTGFTATNINGAFQQIHNGPFTLNNFTLSSGTLNGTITNNASIYGGTFQSNTLNNFTLSSGTLNGTITFNGILNGTITNNAIFYNGLNILTGNVNIGTTNTTSQEKLQVNGNIRINDSSGNTGFNIVYDNTSKTLNFLYVGT